MSILSFVYDLCRYRGCFHFIFVAYICLTLKKILSVFLLVAILSQTFLNVGIGIYYHLNKTYITRKLCENRSNPKLHCNGHCYLSKQLKKAEEGESKSTQSVKEKEEIISSNISEFTFACLPPFNVIKLRPANFVFYSSENNIPLIKPPSAATA